MDKVGNVLESRSAIGSTGRLIKLKSAMISAREGVVGSAQPYETHVSAQSLAVVDVAKSRDKVDRLTAVIMAGDSVFGLVIRGQELRRDYVSAQNAFLLQLPFGRLRSDPGRNSSPQVVLANVELTGLSSGDREYSIGSRASSLSADRQLLPHHFAFSVHPGGEITIATGDINYKGRDQRAFVLDRAMLESGVLGPDGTYEANLLVDKLIAETDLWDPSKLPAPALSR